MPLLFHTLGLILFLAIAPITVNAQTEPTITYTEGQVTAVLENQTTQTPDGSQAIYQKLQIELTDGQTIVTELNQFVSSTASSYQTGDRVVLTVSQNPDGTIHYTVTDYVRRGGLVGLLVLFLAVAVAVAGFKGISSTLGLVFSFFVIFAFILPQINHGHNPTWVAIAGAGAIMPVTFYLSHGLHRKTTVAILGTLAALVVTGLLGQFFINLTYLSGFSSDEAIFLNLATQGNLNMRGLLLAGIIIGALGILDDITISQAAIVQELKSVNPGLTSRELFFKAMNVGRDHIASLINTLILVYTGASLPLLLLFLDGSIGFANALNFELVAEEVVRTLVGSIGLVLAVPITTLIAARFLGNAETQPHHH